MFLLQLALRNRDVAGQAGLRGEQIVETGVAAAVGHVETNRQQSPGLVEEKVKLGVA